MYMFDRPLYISQLEWEVKDMVLLLKPLIVEHSQVVGAFPFLETKWSIVL